MSRDRITQIRIRGLRVIEDVILDLAGLMVLIGDNGSGKSTILEAFEILRLAATPGIKFTQDILHGKLGPVTNLIRVGSSELSLGVVALSRVDYQVPFETRPIRQQKELGVQKGPRWPNSLEPTETLSRYGTNLASCFNVLKNRNAEVWERVLDRARLALGHELRDI